jgi:hypothetical protein
VVALLLFVLLIALAVIGSTNLSQCNIEPGIQPGGYVLVDHPGLPVETATTLFPADNGQAIAPESALSCR